MNSSTYFAPGYSPQEIADRRQSGVYAHPSHKPVKNSLTSAAATTRRQQLFDRDGSVCQICTNEFPPDKLNLDHIIPRSRGGSNVLENLQLTCYFCNTLKGSMLPEEFTKSRDYDLVIRRRP